MSSESGGRKSRYTTDRRLYACARDPDDVCQVGRIPSLHLCLAFYMRVQHSLLYLLITFWFSVLGRGEGSCAHNFLYIADPYMNYNVSFRYMIIIVS